MKIRRTALVATAAAALALAPSAAFAYGAADFENGGTVSDTTPAVGQATIVSVVGPPNTSVTLTVTTNPTTLPDSAITIAGTKSAAKVTDAAGAASFSVTIAQAATATLVVTDTATGNVISTQTIAVGGGAPAGNGQLSSTGSNAVPIALGAGALVLVGAGGVVLARRRQAGTAA